MGDTGNNEVLIEVRGLKKSKKYPTYQFGSGEGLESLKEAVEGLGRRTIMAAGDVRDDAAICGAAGRSHRSVRQDRYLL